MAYFKINNIDFSMYVNKLKVAKEHIYKSMTNANGNLLVKHTNSKRVIEVGIIPLDAATMRALQVELDKFKVTVSYLNPNTQQLETINAIIPQNSVEYYTIQGANNVKFNAFALTFTEL